MSDAPYGYRIVGSVEGRRRLVDAGAALAAYAACDPTAEVGKEAYLSAFCFPAEFRDHLTSTGSTRGYDGRCWSSYLWLDIDHEGNLAAALLDACRLVGRLLPTWRPQRAFTASPAGWPRRSPTRPALRSTSGSMIASAPSALRIVAM